jgi:hypothetical protein
MTQLTSREQFNPLYGSGNYSFGLTKFPEISFMLQSVNLPGIELGVIQQTSSVHDVPVPGETMTYDDLSVSFIVDENLVNYLAIQSWIVGMGYPENHEQYRAALRNSKNSGNLSELSKGFTDAVLTIMGNNQLPIVRASFRDCFPSRLSGIDFNAANTDSDVIIAQVTFSYSYYSIEIMNK